MQTPGKDNALLPTPTERKNKIQCAFSWKPRALSWVDEARKAGVWNPKEKSYRAKWKPGREGTDLVPKGPRGTGWGG